MILEKLFSYEVLSMSDSQNILKLAVDTGEALLKNGGEIYRVHDTIIHILEAYGITDHEVYVLSNGIFASVNNSGETPVSLIRNVPLGSIHLARISALNELSREICRKKPPLEEACEKLEQCGTIPETRGWVKILACCFGSGAFCYLLGGSWIDSIFASLLGLFLQTFLNFAQKKKASKFFSNILGSVIVSGGSVLLSLTSLPITASHVIIGSSIALFPGVIFTTSIRDFFNGDHLSGTIHLIDALLTAICIGVGIGAVMIFYQKFAGGRLL